MKTVDPRYPAKIHKLWATLDRETTWLHGRWIIYLQLFGTNKERVQLLNESGGSFFNLLQVILLHDIQLTLSKLGDPAYLGNKENMTLRALNKELKDLGEMVAANKMKEPLQKFAAACEKIRHRRNKWIAHFDRPTMLNDNVNPRMGPSREEIEHSLEALREAMNCISLHYTDMTILYEEFSMQADGEILVKCLRQSLRYRELVNEGVVARDDYRNRFSGEA